MCPDENISEDYGRRKGFRRGQNLRSSGNMAGMFCDKNKNKFEMYGWRNPVPQVAHSVPSVFHSPTLQDIPEESDENSDDGQPKQLSSNDLIYSRTGCVDRCQSFPTQIVYESDFSARESDIGTFVNIAHSGIQVDGSKDKAAVPMIDQEFTDMLFLQLQIVKKTLLEMKEQKQKIEDELQYSLKENEQLRKEINILSEKNKGFQKQEAAMIADRRELTSQVISVREAILAKEKTAELLIENLKSMKENKDQVIQQENVKLAEANEQYKSKLENAQNTIRKMMEEKKKWTEEEMVLRKREKEMEKENGGLEIQLEVYKQKVKKLEAKKNSEQPANSITSEQFCEIKSPKSQEPTKSKPNTSYEEVVSSTPAIPGEKADRILENILLTPKKNASQSADSSKHPSHVKLSLKETQNLQNESSGVAGLLIPNEIKESLMLRSDYKTLMQRIGALEAKFTPLMTHVDKTIKNQQVNEEDLEKRFNQSILTVTNQISSLRKMFETVMKSQLENKKSPTTNSVSTNTIQILTKPDSNLQSASTSTNIKTTSKNLSKSNIPVYVNRKSC